MLKSLDDAGRKSWASNIKHLLFSLGFGYLWIAQEVGHQAFFITSFKRRLSDCYLQKWNESLRTTSKAEYYLYYKSLLTSETYLFINLPYSFKQSLVRFRTSTHDLMIEKGRHLGIDKDLRLCLFCKEWNIQVIETEVHFLIECSKYDSIRKDIFWLRFFSRT